MSSEDRDATTPLTSHGDGVGGDDKKARAIRVRGFQLEVIEGPEKGSSWQADTDRCTVGVHPSCSFVVADTTVSRFHCEIVMTERGARVRDLGSMNGTVVDGVRVIEAFLENGRLLHIGRTVLRFRHAGKSNAVRLSERTRFGELVGESVAMRAMFAILEPAARTDVTILLEGETGTGKSAAARSIHKESRRRDASFVVVDCGSIPANLLESELFGHEKGAFTGAAGERIGVFEEAAGGTVFLDELGELPVALQPKLLGVLENRAIRRLGSNIERPVDVRVIAATNRDLRAAVNAGTFREDLYYRVAVVSLQVPALRRRLDDLPVLARSLLTRLGASDERIESLVTPELMGALQSAAWPGNIRELRNYLEQYLIFEDALPMELEYSENPAMAIDIRIPFSDARQKVINEFERRYVEELVRAHGGKVSAAAAAAGMNRTYLYRLVQRHKIEK